MAKITSKKFDTKFVSETFDPTFEIYNKIYPPIFLEELFLLLKVVDPKEKADLKKAVINAAAHFEIGKRNHFDSYKPQSEVKEIMGRFQKHLQSATETYREIINDMSFRMHFCETATIHFGKIRDNFEGRPTIASFFPHDENSMAFRDIQIMHLIDFMAITANNAKDREFLSPANDAGLALKMWLSALEKGWPHKKAKFTEGKYQVESGYDSLALRAMCKIMKPLDRKIPKESIATALKKVKANLK